MDDPIFISQEAIWAQFGKGVTINDGLPVLAIYDETRNEYDAMNGVARQLSFKRDSGVRIKKGDRIKFVKTGKELKALSNSYRELDMVVVNL